MRHGKRSRPAEVLAPGSDRTSAGGNRAVAPSAARPRPGARLAAALRRPGAPLRDLQQRYADLARRGLRNAADTQSPDFLNYHEGSQPLVDCGFLSQAILRAPDELWKKLDP